MAIGVAPPGFFGVDPAKTPDVYLPLHTDLVLNPEELRAWREEHHLTRQEAAKQLKISWRTIEAYEQGLRVGMGLPIRALKNRMAGSPKKKKKKKKDAFEGSIA